MIRVTIYDALALRLGREPTNAELKAEVERIKAEGWAEQRTMRKSDAPKP